MVADNPNLPKPRPPEIPDFLLGSNTLTINEMTMRKIVQGYINSFMNSTISPTVESVEYENHTFKVKLKGPEK